MLNRFLRVAFVAAGLTPFVVVSVVAQDAARARRPRRRRCPGRRAGWTRRRARTAGRTRRGPPAKPAPRGADGRALLGSATPTEKGVWLPGNGGGQAMVADLAKVPFQPWAKALHAERGRNQLEPHTRCKPSGFVRQFLTPYGVEIVELAEMQRVYIFDIGGPHTYRTIYTDGRTHPANLEPSFYGHSIGWWEGDTLVVDTAGFNESFWMDRRGLPHTEKLRTLERFTRTDSNTIKYEVTVDDPGAYTAPWKSEFNLGWEAGHRAVRIRLPGSQLRPHPHGRRQDVGRPHQHDRSLIGCVTS